MRRLQPRVNSTFSWLAGGLACIVFIALPLFYFGFSYQYESAALETEAEINALSVTQIINTNPELWRYEEHRLRELMARRPSKGIKETRRILDRENSVIAESTEQLGWPTLKKSGTLLDSGTVVGRLEIIRSLRPLLIRTIFSGFCSALLGLTVFLTLRVFPLRALRKTLASLAEEKERAHVTLKSIGDGVISTDREGNVLLINTVGEKLTGWRQEEAKGKPLSGIFRIFNEKTREPSEHPLNQVMKSGKTVSAEHCILVSRGGTEKIIAESAAPIRDWDGLIIGVVLVFRDIGELLKLEGEIMKARKLESLGILAGGIAHDFNNILTAILGNVSLALIQAGRDNPVFARLSAMEKACMRARDLTQQLLTFSRGGAPIKQAASLSELLRESVEFALSGSNIKCRYSFPADLWHADIDKGQISQVVHNLIINSTEAMPTGGTISITAENIITGKDKSLPLPGGKYIRVSVKDQGHGIQKEFLPKIFDPYFTTKQKGSGLGLATCYSIIRNHNGHITAESSPGAWTVFSFYVPASTEALMARAVNNDPLRGHGRVLLMDDEEIVRDIACNMLLHLGYEVSCAADGAEALALFKDGLDGGIPFDAVIFDLTVPGGMGGKEAVVKLREIEPSARAIVSSGYSNDPIMADFRDYGFSGRIVKPYKIEDMGVVLNKVLSNGKICS